MALSYVEFLSNGQQTLFSLPFDYLDQSYIHACVTAPDAWGKFTGEALDVGFVFAVGTHQIRLNTAAPQGHLIRIERRTELDHPLVVFADPAHFQKEEINRALTQLLHLAQEVKEQRTVGDPTAVLTSILTMHNAMQQALEEIGDIQDEVTATLGSAQAWIQTARNDSASAASAAAASAAAAAESATEAAASSGNDMSGYVKKNDLVTTTVNGLMMAADKIKLNAYPATPAQIAPVTTTVNGLMSSGDKTKLDTYPATPVQIAPVTTTVNGLMSSGDKTKLNAYPATPAQIAPVATAANGLMLATDKTKLDGLYNLPVGSILWLTGKIAPANFIAPTGDLLSRAAYPELFAFAQSSGMLTTEAYWLAAGGSNVGYYSTGDDSTTFRLPRMGGYFLRAWVAGQAMDGGRAAGSTQGDAIRNITGTLNANMFNGASGAFDKTGGAGVYGTTSAMGVNTATFDASRVVPTAAENRPLNIAYPCFIKYK